MKTGDELDEKVADIVYPNWRDNFGKPDWPDLPHYSTDIKEAMVAFEWLEQNHPWGEVRLLLGRNCKDCSPFVFVTGKDGFTDEDFYILGHTYEEAICLAALQAKEDAR